MLLQWHDEPRGADPEAAERAAGDCLGEQQACGQLPAEKRGAGAQED